jgi:hypothetical protein
MQLMPNSFVKTSWQKPYNIPTSSATSLNSQQAIGTDDIADMGNIFLVFGS